MKMHDYLNVTPCMICTPCIIWFRNGYSGIFRLWDFRKYKLLCVSNVHNKEYAPLKENDICIFLYISVWNIFSDRYVTGSQVHFPMKLWSWYVITTPTWKYATVIHPTNCLDNYWPRIFCSVPFMIIIWKIYWFLVD